MGLKRTYVLSMHEPDGRLVLEEVRTRRQAHLSSLSEIGRQISLWRQTDQPRENSGEAGPQTNSR